MIIKWSKRDEILQILLQLINREFILFLGEYYIELLYEKKKIMRVRNELLMEYEKFLYVMMEGNFIKENGRNIKEDNSDLFPYNWYLTDNYKLKTEILYEAIQTKKKIVETEKYQLMIEGVNE